MGASNGGGNMKMQSLVNAKTRMALAALMIGGSAILFSPDKAGNLFAKDRQTAYLNLSVSMEQMLSRPEYAEDLKIHKKVASGEITYDDNKGGLMPNTSTYIMSIGGKLLPLTMDKDSLRTRFGFSNFPEVWRSKQRDRQTSGIVGAVIPEWVGGSNYTEALIYGKETVENGTLKTLGGVIAIYTLDDQPSEENTAYAFHPLGTMENGKPKEGEFGSLIRIGAVGKQFLAKIKGKQNPLYDPYKVMQEEGGNFIMTEKGSKMYCLMMPPGFTTLFDMPTFVKSGSKTKYTASLDSILVTGEDQKFFGRTSMISGAKDFVLNGTLDMMSNDDKLTHVILREGDENGVGLEQALAIEQKSGKVLMTGLISPQDAQDQFKVVKLGGSEDNKKSLGVGYYPIIGGHGSAWVTSTPNGVHIEYAKSDSNLIRSISIPKTGEEELVISNPDAPLNRQEKVFKVSDDQLIIAWLVKGGTLKIYYPKSCFYHEITVPKDLVSPLIDINENLQRVTLNASGSEVRSVGMHEAIYIYIGEELKYRPR